MKKSAALLLEMVLDKLLTDAASRSIAEPNR